MRNCPRKSNLFKGRHFEQEIIVLCVRCYLRYKLSYRDLVEMMAEGGLSSAHTTILRWVRRYKPEFDKRWNCLSAQAVSSWRVDETYARIRQWAYLYWAVDSAARLSIFGSARDATPLQPRHFFAKRYVLKGGHPRL